MNKINLFEAVDRAARLKKVADELNAMAGRMREEGYIISMETVTSYEPNKEHTIIVVGASLAPHMIEIPKQQAAATPPYSPNDPPAGGFVPASVPNATVPPYNSDDQIRTKIR